MIDGFSRPPDSMISGSKPRDGVVARRYINNETVSGDRAGLADDITYDVIVRFDGGDQVLERVAPSNDRPEVEIYPASPGSPVLIHWWGDEMRFLIVEQPKYEDCESTPESARPESIISRVLRSLGV
jgi:hypothetical protein